MQFRQQRRRRTWIEDAPGAEPPVGRASGGRASSRAARETYTASARRDEQPRVTDFVPTRFRVLSLLFMVGLLVVSALEGLHQWSPVVCASLGIDRLSACDLASPNGAGAWFSSLLSGLAALVCALLFSLRRHRIDDYRGRYRVWIWATLGWLALSVDQTTDLDRLVEAGVRLGCAACGVNADWAWPALQATLLALVIVRLLVEMRHAPLACSVGLLGVASWSLAAWCPADWPADWSLTGHTMLVAGLRLGGQLVLLMSLVLFARHVLLDAHGLLPARKAGTKPLKTSRRQLLRKTAQEESSADPAHAVKSPRIGRGDLDGPSIDEEPTTRPALILGQGVTADGDLTGDSDDDGSQEGDTPAQRGLSRAERKKLRREQRRS